ncbi:hypothetical protein MMC13_002685 [Lambiella insularis]|nr:hypothetical protein [Lambiella insularis]
MPSAYRIVIIPLRIGQIAFALTVAGIVGKYMHDGVTGDLNAPIFQFIAIATLAFLSAFTSALGLVPIVTRTIYCVIETVMFIEWIVIFGLLFHFVGTLNCGSLWAWGDLTAPGQCSQWKAAVAFGLLSAAFWFLSLATGLITVHRLSNIKNWYHVNKLPK